jgi:hypothetical protein
MIDGLTKPSTIPAPAQHGTNCDILSRWSLRRSPSECVSCGVRSGGEWISETAIVARFEDSIYGMPFRTGTADRGNTNGSDSRHQRKLVE